MADLLFECFSEEMPARMQVAAAEQLQTKLCAALGVIRIILQNNLRMKLRVAFDKAASLYPKKIFAESKEATVQELLGFFEDRLKVMLKGDGVRHDVIEAAMSGGADDLVLIEKKARHLQAFLDGEDGANLLAAYRRASNILTAEEKKDGTRYDGKPSESALQQAEEKQLYAALKAVMPNVEKHIKQELFGDVMRELSSLRAPLDAYFERVMVNTDDAAVRINRLHTLNMLREALACVADFDKLEG